MKYLPNTAEEDIAVNKTSKLNSLCDAWSEERWNEILGDFLEGIIIAISLLEAEKWISGKNICRIWFQSSKMKHLVMEESSIALLNFSFVFRGVKQIHCKMRCNVQRKRDYFLLYAPNSIK